jgi:hypothetical protein
MKQNAQIGKNINSFFIHPSVHWQQNQNKQNKGKQ